MKVAEDMRPDYAQKLRKFAEHIEAQGAQPVGCAVFVFWHDHTSTVLQKSEAGSINVLMGGALIKIGNEILQEPAR